MSEQSEAQRIIKYCIKSMYLDRDFLLDNEENLMAILAKKSGDTKMEEKIEKLITNAEKEWEEYRPKGSKETKEYLKTQDKIFNDSVHKSIVLNALEVAVVDTPEFSRLRGIKQLGGACYVYPGAVHSRFEHSIGVCHLAGKFIDKLKQKLVKYRKSSGRKARVTIEEDEELCVRLAALCHDLGHGPFSHMFEHLRKKILKKYNEEYEENLEKISHEEISVLLFKHLLVKNMKVLSRFQEFGLKWKHVWMIEFMIDPGEKDKTTEKSQERETVHEGIPAEGKSTKTESKSKKRKIKPKNKKDFLYEIVANKESGMDVDKWDYYARDCHYLGVTNEFDYGRSMELSSIGETREGGKVVYHIGFQEKEMDNIYRMFRTRTVLYQKAYVHKVVDAVEMMISDALFEIRNEKILFVGTGMSLTEIVKQFVKDPTRIIYFDGYVALKDSILDIIETFRVTSSRMSDSIKKAQDILTKLKTRELYWCCGEVIIPGKNFKSVDTYEGNIKAIQGKSFDERLREDTAGNYEAEAPKLAYSSEDPSKNPVKEIHFYKKEEYLPELSKQKDFVSILHIPQTFIEYRVRLYCKEEKTRKRKHHSESRYEELLTKRIKRKKPLPE